MPCIETVRFGPLHYTENSVIEFPAGIPAFESERQFLLLRPPKHEPLIFLQSLITPALSFLAIAVENIVLDYDVELSEEELQAVGGPGPRADFEVLALITVGTRGEVSANLKAPVVIHRGQRRAVQAIQTNTSYSARHPMGAAAKSPQEFPCS